MALDRDDHTVSRKRTIVPQPNPPAHPCQERGCDRDAYFDQRCKPHHDLSLHQQARAVARTLPADPPAVGRVRGAARLNDS